MPTQTGSIDFASQGGFKSYASGTYATQGSVTEVSTAIEQLQDNVVISATETDTTATQGGQHVIQSLINVAPSGVTIDADKVNIEGAAIFTSGRLSQTSLDSAYDANGAAAAANSKEQLVYKSATSGTSSMQGTDTWVSDVTGAQGTWTAKRPQYDSNYPVLFVATQRQTVGGTVTCTTPQIDNTTTVIDGGNIITGSVTASKLDASNINASNSLTIGAMTTATQSAVLNSELSGDISDAAKTATNYIRADGTGIRIASTDPSESTTTTYQHQTSNKTEFVVSGATMSDVSGNGLRAYDGLGTAAANILAQFTTSGAQIGKASTEHVTIDTDGMDFRDGGTSLALFGADGARIGSTSGTNIAIGSDEASINDASRKVFKAALSDATITTRSGESTRPAVSFDSPSMGSIGSINIRPSSGFDGDTTYLKWLDGFDIDIDIRDLLFVSRNNVQVITINSGGLQFTRPVYETDTHTIDGHSLVTTTDSIGSGVTLSEDTGGTGVYFREGNVGADNLGYVRSFGRSGSDKLRGVQIGGRNTFNANYNFLYLLTDEDGNRVVQVSEAAPWQKALYTHYLPGDTISGSVRAGGYVTNSTKDIRWTIPLSRPISGSVSCTSMSMTVRIAGTYVYGTSSGNTSVPVANLTYEVTPSGIDCQYRAASAISGATNNSECSVQVSYSFTVS